ncbi:zinc-ribbon domain-containing protein [Pseudoroseicyclus sp. CXY001]|uniref:zinc-ribbon domain-containing protein n=1 Tax=Pseudoroseicyclus sp. CXY001 TaxID=3242492 RepID=UPI00358DA34C
MRLICPNCGAEYEVPDDVIPDEGRDVQCSACSHTWFERPGASVAEEAAPAPPPARRMPPPVAEPEGMEDLPASLRALAEPPGGRTPAPGAPPAPRRVTPPPPREEPEEAPMRPSVTPEIAAILREEAAREAEQRRRERMGGMETQTELDLPEAARAAPAPTPAPDAPDPEDPPLRRRPVRPGFGGADSAAPRRELLPDIDELHTSLRPESEPEPAEEPEDTAAVTRRGFRRGFSLTLFALAILALAYAFAPNLSELFPAAAPALERYVDAVNAGRVWLDVELQSLTTRLNNIAGDS